MIGLIDVKTVNAPLGYFIDMLLSIDHIASDELDESFCVRNVDDYRLEAAFREPYL